MKHLFEMIVSVPRVFNSIVFSKDFDMFASGSISLLSESISLCKKTIIMIWNVSCSCHPFLCSDLLVSAICTYRDRQQVWPSALKAISKKQLKPQLYSSVHQSIWWRPPSTNSGCAIPLSPSCRLLHTAKSALRCSNMSHRAFSFNFGQFCIVLACRNDSVMTTGRASKPWDDQSRRRVGPHHAALGESSGATAGQLHFFWKDLNGSKDAVLPCQSCPGKTSTVFLIRTPLPFTTFEMELSKCTSTGQIWLTVLHRITSASWTHLRQACNGNKHLSMNCWIPCTAISLLFKLKS